MTRIDDIQMSPVERLATRLESDMRRRGLVLGDQYLTAAEAGHKFGVSLTTANRAMQVLANRDVLVRQRSRGSFVGPAVEGSGGVEHKTLHVLMFDTRRRPPRLSYNDLLDGVSERVSVASLKFTRVPEEGCVQFVKKTIEHDIQSGVLFGVVAIGFPREVYRYLQDRNIPVVVLGSLYADTMRLPSVDLDMRQVGHLMAEHLIRRGRRRLALIAMEDWRPGDNLILEGVHGAMSDAGLAPEALVVRSTAPEISAVVPEVRHLLERDDPPTGFICRHRAFVEATCRAAELAGLNIPGDLEAVVDASNTQHLAGLDVPCCLPEKQTRGIAAVLGEMLCDIHEEKEIRPRRVLIPVVMHATVPK